MNEIQYGLVAKWSKDERDPDAIGFRFIRLLEALSPLNPVLNHWRVMDYADLAMPPLEEVRSQISSLVSKNANEDDDGEIDPDEGYGLMADGAERPPVGEELERLRQTPRSVDVSIRAGSSWLNNAHIDLGGSGFAPDLALVTYPLFIQMLKALASTWPCPWIEAHAYVPDPEPIQPAKLPLSLPGPGRPREEYYFPWLLYLSSPFVAGLNPPRDLICENTPGGGVILSAVAERLDPSNPDHVRRSRLLAAIIAERLPKSQGQPMLVPPPRVGPY